MKDDISDGIGLPDWRLASCLLLFWIMLFLTLAWGIKSSGKVRQGHLFVLSLNGDSQPGTGVAPGGTHGTTGGAWTPCRYAVSAGAVCQFSRHVTHRLDAVLMIHFVLTLEPSLRCLDTLIPKRLLTSQGWEPPPWITDLRYAIVSLYSVWSRPLPHCSVAAGGVLHGAVPIRGAGHAAHPRGNAARGHRRDALLHHAKVGEAARPQRKFFWNNATSPSCGT